MSLKKIRYIGVKEIAKANIVIIQLVKSELIKNAFIITDYEGKHFSIYFENDGLEFYYSFNFYFNDGDIESIDDADKEYAGYENAMEFLELILKEGNGNNDC